MITYLGLYLLSSQKHSSQTQPTASKMKMFPHLSTSEIIETALSTFTLHLFPPPPDLQKHNYYYALLLCAYYAQSLSFGNTFRIIIIWEIRI